MAMNLSGNTVLITGGGSGIGRRLAEAFERLGNQVVIAGRRQEALDETTGANPGIHSAVLDIQDAGAIPRFAEEISSRFPSLNVLINNAGIMRTEKLLDEPTYLADAEEIVATNLLGPIRLTAALLPHLKKQANATIMNVSSGLAFVPMVITPTYCATKAAIHSYSQSLRFQLKKTSIEVLELIPPYVATDLMGGKSDSRAMPLDKYIAEVMNILRTKPTPAEICVESVQRLRFAAENGRYDAVFQGLNSGME
jgi:uncharacterized oxidoreductase